MVQQAGQLERDLPPKEEALLQMRLSHRAACR